MENLQDKIISRISIWDKNDNSVFDTYSLSELKSEIGESSSPLIKIGENINVGGISKKITDISFGITNNSLSKFMMVIHLE